MKKIVSILFVALIALAFMGCPTTYPDLEYGIKDPNFIHNWDANVNGGKGFKTNDYAVTADGYTTSFDLPALASGNFECCLSIATDTGDAATWEVQYGGEVANDGEFHDLAVGGNLKIITGGSAGTVTLKVSGTTVSARFVAK